MECLIDIIPNEAIPVPKGVEMLKHEDYLEAIRRFKNKKDNALPDSIITLCCWLRRATAFAKRLTFSSSTKKPSADGFKSISSTNSMV